MASHKSDHGKIPLNHAMEDVNWVLEGSRWICNFNGCIDSYMVKWLYRQHLDNKHSHHMEASKYGRPSTCVGGPRQQNHHAMNARILNNPQAWQTQNEKKVIDWAMKKGKANGIDFNLKFKALKRFIDLYWQGSLLTNYCVSLAYLSGVWGSSLVPFHKSRRMMILLKSF